MQTSPEITTNKTDHTVPSDWNS